MIISDDGSKAEHVIYLLQLRRQYGFRLLTTPANCEKGSDINLGQDATTLPFTLYLQEDFEPTSNFVPYFTNALTMMEHDEKWDIARLYSSVAYPYTKPLGEGFSEMKFHHAPWYTNHNKFYMYTDEPHLRRSNFLQKFGRYSEAVPRTESEYRMAVSFIKKKGKGLFCDNHTMLFTERKERTELYANDNNKIIKKRKNVIAFVQAVYLKIRLLKCTFDLAFMR